MIYSILSLLVLVLDIYVLYLIWTSSIETGPKILWTILVLLLPIIGPVLYFLVGPGKSKVAA
jgi:hypothetical protein